MVVKKERAWGGKLFRAKDHFTTYAWDRHFTWHFAAKQPGSARTDPRGLTWQRIGAEMR